MTKKGYKQTLLHKQRISEVSPEIDEVKLNKAEECHKEVLARTIITANNLLELGNLFKTIRDEKLYKLLGADTFNEYCGFPEISFGRSTIYSFIHVHELYVLKLGYNPEVLSKIGHRKLQIVSSVVNDELKVDGDTAFWLDNAEVLSESDLINAVRGFQGKPPMIPKPKEVEDTYPFSFEEYLDFIRAHPCIICGKRPSDAAHFPRSKGAGGENTHRVPLCRACHSESHQDPFDFLWLHKDKIFRYFYNLFLKCFELTRTAKC